MAIKQLPADYVERVYAGVLGKMIGVYLGRPFEGWEYERIMRELGEVYYYVHDKIGVPLIVTDVKPHMVKACGIAARVQGMRRYYALLITSGQRAQLVKELDGEQILE